MKTVLGFIFFVVILIVSWVFNSLVVQWLWNILAPLFDASPITLKQSFALALFAWLLFLCLKSLKE
jgi:hypothetical protein